MSRSSEGVSELEAADQDEAASAVAAAQRHFGQRRWAHAAEVLTTVRTRSPGLEMQWRLARNFAVLEAGRPDVYERVISASGSGVCRPALSRRGDVTLIHTLPPREPVMLSPGG